MMMESAYLPILMINRYVFGFTRIDKMRDMPFDKRLKFFDENLKKQHKQDISDMY